MCAPALARRATSCLVAAIALVLVALAPVPPAFAQTSLKDQLGGFSTNPDAPIDIEADSLEVDDVKKTALFRGNVKAVQGAFTLRAKEMLVTYTGSAGAGGSGQAARKPEAGAAGSSQIRRIDARGKVLITSKDKRSATSDWAIFDVAGQTVTIGGNVILSQNGDVIKAEKVVIDLATGRTRFEMSKRRVRMLVKPRPRKEKARKGAKAGKGGKASRGTGRSRRDGTAAAGSGTAHGTGGAGDGAAWRVDVEPRRQTGVSSSPVLSEDAASQ